MKILLLSPIPPPVGGIASWSLNILKHYIANSTSSVELIHQNTAMQYRAITKHGFIRRFFSGAFDTLRITAVLFYCLVKYKPDAIHITSSGSLAVIKDLWLVLVARLFFTPVVIHYRFGRIPDIRSANKLEWKILKIVTSLCAATIVLDEKSFKALKDESIKDLYNIPNPISAHVACFTSKASLIDVKKNCSKVEIIFVGHVVKNKGVFELVKACKNLNDISELTLIGPYEDSVKQELLNIASEGEVLCLNFLGILSKDEVLVKMKEATLLVLPSYTEGFPNVIIEAMAMRCPVVATNVGAIPEMLDFGTLNPAGLVVQPKNVQDLTTAIKSVISDENLSDILKNNALIKVNEKYTLEKVCAEYEKVWKKALQN
jgi:glycosyltransferase involved in cell wall biosynthesis